MPESHILCVVDSHHLLDELLRGKKSQEKCISWEESIQDKITFPIIPLSITSLIFTTGGKYLNRTRLWYIPCITKTTYMLQLHNKLFVPEHMANHQHDSSILAGLCDLPEHQKLKQTWSHSDAINSPAIIFTNCHRLLNKNVVAAVGKCHRWGHVVLALNEYIRLE